MRSRRLLGETRLPDSSTNSRASIQWIGTTLGLTGMGIAGALLVAPLMWIQLVSMSSSAKAESVNRNGRTYRCPVLAMSTNKKTTRRWLS